MKIEEEIRNKIGIAEKRIVELISTDDIKKISEKEKYEISKFYEDKSMNRLKTARLIYEESKSKEDY